MPNHNGVSVSVTISDQQVEREEILGWEAARIPRVAHKLGVPVPTGSIERMKKTLRDNKFDLGPDLIRQRLARDVRWSEAIAATMTRVSLGRRAISACDLHVLGGSAQAFVDWFSDTGRSDYASSMVAANPDHYVIETAADDSQEVVEATGGSPFASRFFVDYSDTSSLCTPPSPAFSIELAGVARTESGVAIGGVRHQLRDTPNGFHLRACVEFPRLMLPHMINQHRWHLACEFSNWIEAAFAG